MDMTTTLIGSAMAFLATGAIADAAAAAAAAEEPVRLETPGGVVHGTLLVPQVAGKHPVVLISPSIAPACSRT